MEYVYENGVLVAMDKASVLTQLNYGHGLMFDAICIIIIAVCALGPVYLAMKD